MRTLFLVAIGGALGSVFRYLVSQWVPRALPGDFPWATFGINLLGSFLIGALMGRLAPEDTGLRFLLVTGFCGGFTTFSAFAYETMQLVQNGNYVLAVSYAAGSMLVGTALVVLGMRIFTGA